MTNLQRFDRDGIELLINIETGESFATSKGYSRMSTIAYDTIKKRCQRGGLENTEIPTEQGMRWGTLIPEALIAEWLPKDNPEMATKMMMAGIRLFLHGIAGFKYEVKKEKDHTLPSPALISARECREIIDLLEFDNPRLAQVLIDGSVNHHLGEKFLTGIATIYRGVVEIAEEMGYKVDISSRIKLGKFISSMNKFESKKEKRLCNGTMQQINCYEDTPELREAIALYFH